MTKKAEENFGNYLNYGFHAISNGHNRFAGYPLQGAVHPYHTIGYSSSDFMETKSDDPPTSNYTRGPPATTNVEILPHFGIVVEAKKPTILDDISVKLGLPTEHTKAAKKKDEEAQAYEIARKSEQYIKKSSALISSLTDEKQRLLAGASKLRAKRRLTPQDQVSLDQYINRITVINNDIEKERIRLSSVQNASRSMGNQKREEEFTEIMGELYGQIKNKNSATSNMDDKITDIVDDTGEVNDMNEDIDNAYSNLSEVIMPESRTTKMSSALAEIDGFIEENDSDGYEVEDSRYNNDNYTRISTKSVKNNAKTTQPQRMYSEPDQTNLDLPNVPVKRVPTKRENVQPRKKSLINKTQNT